MVVMVGLVKNISQFHKRLDFKQEVVKQNSLIFPTRVVGFLGIGPEDPLEAKIYWIWQVGSSHVDFQIWPHKKLKGLHHKVIIVLKWCFLLH